MDQPVNSQNVLVDNSVIMQLPLDQPGDSSKAIVESHASGPLVIDRSRIQLMA
jgi:hypothetical protein